MSYLKTATVLPALALLASAASATTITHSASQEIWDGNSVSCNNGFGHTDNSYYRTFTLADFGIADPFNISAVEVGIELAFGAGGDQPVSLNIYNTTNLNALGAPLASAGYSITDGQSASIVSLPINALIDTGGFTVEFFTPDGQVEGNLLWVGSNGLGQTGPSYIRADLCGIVSPTDLAAIGFGNMHIVMNVVGDAVPTPGAGALLGLAGLAAARRRR
jgi:hypothetical protein